MGELVILVLVGSRFLTYIPSVKHHSQLIGSHVRKLPLANIDFINEFFKYTGIHFCIQLLYMGGCCYEMVVWHKNRLSVPNHSPRIPKGNWVPVLM